MTKANKPSMAEMLQAIDEAEDLEGLEEGQVEYHRPQPPREPSQVYSVRIPIDQLQLLRELADEEGITPSAFVRRLVLQGLQRAIAGPSEVDALTNRLIELEQHIVSQEKTFNERLDELSSMFERHNQEVAAALSSPTTPVPGPS